ncbi:hypothetical protein [Methanococcus maripaludis]|uniref:Uncharacterized protein n=1 Tax=Methanococcus maripaludis TaxID=39152 RepID=A0A8T4CL54_METMI|nr:hypothetical protein [Methanococcus maripaludis]MBM7408732.1 hypothetical protein [Methanococcus maripaludis]MBP2220346.1 hypothetical protein [Methanococcus maripaludis]
MYSITNKRAAKVEATTFSQLGMNENDIEEILRCSIDMLCDDEESLLIVGRQVKNEKHGRSDLTAVDNNGNIVLIEIKRDKKDIENRKEAFEFQAIRYAASYAKIENPDELVKLVYAPYIEKYRNEYEIGELTSYELGIRKLNEFLDANDVTNFNEKQRIILAAGEYDEQTLSAVAWLNKNNVDMNCFQLTPYKINDECYINAEKILPVSGYEDYYVNLMDKSKYVSKKTKDITRRSLPKISDMLEWGVVKPGDVIKAKDYDDEAILLKNGNLSVINSKTSEIGNLSADISEIPAQTSVDTECQCKRGSRAFMGGLVSKHTISQCSKKAVKHCLRFVKIIWKNWQTKQMIS